MRAHGQGKLDDAADLAFRNATTTLSAMVHNGELGQYTQQFAHQYMSGGEDALPPDEDNSGRRRRRRRLQDISSLLSSAQVDASLYQAPTTFSSAEVASSSSRSIVGMAVGIAVACAAVVAMAGLFIYRKRKSNAHSLPKHSQVTAGLPAEHRLV